MGYKVEYLKLVNFIGIWDGAGRKEIEIDFTKGKNRIIMLAGRNASGKTTILSCIHPLAHNADDRKEIVLPKTEGYKEIRIRNVNTNALYVIKHYYTGSVKSYISKNGKELNPNGGVRTFEDIVSKELFFDKSYFKIGRIGDNAQNFIDMTATERKKFIFENFLPNVDEYHHYFKVVKAKYNDLNSKIKFLVDELSKIDDPDNIYQRIEIDTEEIEKNEQNKSKLNSKIMLLQEKISDTMNQLEITNLKQLDRVIILTESEVEEIASELEDIREKHEAVIEKIGDDIDAYIKKLNTKREKFSNELTQLDAFYQNAFSMVSDLEKSLTLEKAKLNRIEGLEDNKDDIVNEIKKGQKEIKKSRELLEETYPHHTEFFANNESLTIDSIYEYKNIVKNIEQNLLDAYSTVALSDTYKEWLLLDKYTTKELSDLIVKLDNDLEKKVNRLNVVELEISNIQSSSSKTNVLKLRPDDCVIDSCGFIREALQAKDRIDKEFPILVEERDSLEKEISAIKDESKTIRSFYEDVYEVLINVKKYLSKYKDDVILNYHLNELTELGMDFNVFGFGEFSVDEIKELFTGIYTEIRVTFVTKNNLDMQEMKLSEFKSKLKLLEQNESIINEITSNIDDIKTKIHTKKDELSEIESSISEVKAKLIKNKKQIEFIEGVVESFSLADDKHKNLTEKQEVLESYSKSKKDIASWNNELNELQIELKEINNSIRILTKSRQDNLTKINRYEDYTETKKRLDEDFSFIKLVYKALDPKDGIPVHLIGNYLKETTRITNNLLDISQKGNFKIDFVVNESEFKIPIITGELGTRKADINLASQGQKALTKVSLSLALVQQNMTGSNPNAYNIPSIDEMDSTLDAENARYFIDMLEMQGTELNAQQMFVISHSREFDSHNVDLILMDGHGLNIERDSFIEGKTILYQNS